jgi:hypothetical protein
VARLRPGTHILKVSLLREPSTYRTIEIASSKSLYAFAEAIVASFDFDHAFGFYSGRTERTLMSAQPQYELFADIGEESEAMSVKKTSVAKAFPHQGHRLTFLFDYGDEWLFDVETIRIAERKPKGRYPQVLTRVGDAPQQYPDQVD